MKTTRSTFGLATPPYLVTYPNALTAAECAAGHMKQNGASFAVLQANVQ